MSDEHEAETRSIDALGARAHRGAISSAMESKSAPAANRFRYLPARRAVRRPLAPAEARALFPEVPEEAFLEPDVFADLDVDRLDTFPTCSLDFVIASHVLEHLSNPLGFMVEMHRVLRPGGLAIILLPDRRRTFDISRPATPLEHLIEDHACGRDPRRRRSRRRVRGARRQGRVARRPARRGRAETSSSSGTGSARSTCTAGPIPSSTACCSTRSSSSACRGRSWTGSS